jgi:E3 ubiquitin-protein ligase TRIP12
VNLLALEHNPDMMLLAARCLTFMADVLPASCSTIVRHGAVPALCSRLLNIEYIDLAEQSLQALEKLAVEHPRALLQAGGLMAVLTYLDFFPSSVQRTAVTTAANMCNGIAPDSFSMVQDAVPQLTQLLQYADAKVVDGACSALLLIVEAFKNNAELLEGLQGHGLIDQARQLVSISDNGTMTAPLSLGTYFGLIKLLATAAGGSAATSEALLNAGITDQLRLLFSNCAMLSTSGGAGAVLRTPDQLFEVVSLAHALLPDMPDAATVVGQGMPSQLPSGQGGAGSGEKQACARLGFLRSEPDVLLNFTNALLPLLLKVGGAAS